MQDLCQELNETENKLRYWLQLLRKHDLVDRKRAFKHDYTDQEVYYFTQIKEHLEDGAETAPEAIRLINAQLTPGQALSKYQQAQRQIEVLQKKVLQLRKPFWERITGWFKGIWNAVMGRQTA